MSIVVLLGVWVFIGVASAVLVHDSIRRRQYKQRLEERLKAEGL